MSGILELLALFIDNVGSLLYVFVGTPLQKLLVEIPLNAHAAEKFLWLGYEQSFVTDAVSYASDTVYDYGECIRFKSAQTELIMCKVVLYPDHLYFEKQNMNHSYIRNFKGKNSVLLKA